MRVECRGGGNYGWSLVCFVYSCGFCFNIVVVGKRKESCRGEFWGEEIKGIFRIWWGKGCLESGY